MEENRNEGAMKKRLFERPLMQIVLAMLASFLLMIAGQELGSVLTLPLLNSENDVLIIIAVYLLFIGIWIVMLLWWLRKKNRPLFRVLGREAEGNSLKTVLALGLPLGFGMNLLLAVCAILNGDIILTFQEINVPYILIFILVVGIQSGAEELVCRAYLYQKIRKALPSKPIVAILGNALFFSALHLWNPGINIWAVLEIAVIGILFSLVIYYYDSFWGCVLAHTGWNFCQNILLGLPNSGYVSVYSIFKLDAASARNSLFYNVNFGIEGTAAAVALGGLAVAVIFLIGRKRKHKPLDIWAPKEVEVPAEAAAAEPVEVPAEVPEMLQGTEDAAGTGEISGREENR